MSCSVLSPQQNFDELGCNPPVEHPHSTHSGNAWGGSWTSDVHVCWMMLDVLECPQWSSIFGKLSRMVVLSNGDADLMKSMQDHKIIHDSTKDRPV